MGQVLVVDDEVNLCETLRVVLGRDRHQVQVAHDVPSACSCLAADPGIQVVLTDLRMNGPDGLELLQRCRQDHPTVSVVVMTAYAAWDTAVEAMRRGAWNFVTKPFDNKALRAVIRRAVDANEHAEAAAADGQRGPTVNLIGNAPSIQEVQRLIEQVGRTDATVLITGESGTGKELVAHGIHYGSLRADGPFVRINSGALTTTLLESELFGHVRGAFTGATEDRPGVFALADGGTLFLDEVGELPPETQVKLLRVLESGEYLPVGGTAIRSCDVRVVTATNRNLQQMVAARTFREDLYYRLAIVGVQLPALRERSSDIPLLAGHLLARNARRLRRSITGFSETAVEALCAYPWPGNVRELDNRIQRAITLAGSDRIEADDLFGDLGTTHTGMWRNIAKTRASMGSDHEDPFADFEPARPTDTDPVEPLIARIAAGEPVDLEAERMVFERKLVQAALDRTDHKLTDAAELLGLNFRQMRYKAKTLGLR